MLKHRKNVNWTYHLSNETKLTFICLNSTIETPEKGVKYVQS